MNLKRLMKRLCSGFMVFALVGTFVPTALAAPSEGVDMYSNHYVIMDGEISKDQLDKTALDKFTPADQAVIGNTSNETLDLWVSSDDMSGDDYQIPYVKDGFGNTWYLQQIVLYNFINDRDESQTLMNADAIVVMRTSMPSSNNTCFIKNPNSVAQNTMPTALKSPPKSRQNDALATDANKSTTHLFILGLSNIFSKHSFACSSESFPSATCQLSLLNSMFR